MKKSVLFILLFASFMMQGFGQEKLKIGDVSDGKLKITNEAALRAFLLDNIEKSGLLGKVIKVEHSPNFDRFVVSMSVTGNAKSITSTGVLLINQGGEAYIVNQGAGGDSSGPGGGGSATYSCVGSPCPNCDFTITWPTGSWLPDVKCRCLESSGQCNMIVSFSVNINFGY